MSSLINFELSKISDWLAVNKLSLNAEKTKYMIFHNYQKVIAENDIPHLTLNGSVIERVTQFNFLGLTINENMNWKSHSSKIANKISRTLGVMNRLKKIPTYGCNETDVRLFDTISSTIRDNLLGIWLE